MSTDTSPASQQGGEADGGLPPTPLLDLSKLASRAEMEQVLLNVEGARAPGSLKVLRRGGKEDQGAGADRVLVILSEREFARTGAALSGTAAR